MLIGYARVSTADQNPDHQIDALLRADVDSDNIHIDTAGRAGPGVQGLLRPQGIARFIDPSAGAGVGRLAGRTVPARRDRPTTRRHRQPVPAPLTTTPSHSAHQGSSGNWTL
jgi:hypothetical protein